MKKLIVFALVILPLSLVAQSTRVFVKQAAEFASFSQTTPDGLNSTSLSVSRIANSGTPATAQLLFTQLSVAADFSTETFTEVSGTIPATSFTGANTSNLVLNVDTSTLDPTTSVAVTCVVDLNALTEVCGPPANGVIQLTFQANNVQNTRIIDLNEIFTNGPITTHIRQKSDNGTANMSGTIFGVAVSSTQATVGVNHESSLEIIM
jgi:hypothetical protein